MKKSKNFNTAYACVFMLVGLANCGSPPSSPGVGVKSTGPADKSVNIGAESMETKELGHSCHQLLIDGVDKTKVEVLLGKPTTMQTENFRAPKYIKIENLPSHDEQWTYIKSEKLETYLIYFKSGKVVFALKEWSDW